MTCPEAKMGIGLADHLSGLMCITYTAQQRGGEVMVNKMSEEAIYEEAKKRVEAKKGFYKHLVVYIVVNIILVMIGRLC